MSGLRPGLVSKASQFSYFRPLIGTSGSFRAVSTGIMTALTAARFTRCWLLAVNVSSNVLSERKRWLQWAPLHEVSFVELYRMISSNTYGAGMEAGWRPLSPVWQPV